MAGGLETERVLLDDAHKPLREFWNSNASWFNAAPGRRTPALVENLLEGIEQEEGACRRVLDLACGAGRTTRELNHRLKPSEGTAGVDLSDVMIRTARSEARVEDAQTLSFHEAAAEDLPFEDASFELAFCNLGLMIFPDPTAALDELGRVLTATGEFRATVWGRKDHTTLVTLMPRVAEMLEIPLERPARSNFHLGNEQALANVAEGTGLALSRARPVTLRFPFDGGKDACAQMGIAMDSPSTRLTVLTEAQRQQLVDGCEAEAERLLALDHGALIMDLLIAEFRPRH